MAFKKPIDEAMRELLAANEEELSHEQIAERIGYNLASVQDYFRRQRLAEDAAKERASQVGAVTYMTSSGRATVTYYPVLGEIKITSKHQKNGHGYPVGESPYLNVSAEDTLEIGIYIMGLQPHIREVLAKQPKRTEITEVEISRLP